jgi:hypothetical protein
VRPAHALVLAGLRQPLGRVVTQRLQHPEPHRLAVVGDDERPVDQAGEQADDLAAVDAAARTDPLGGVCAPAAAEDRQPAEQHLLRLGEQLVAPLHRGPQRPLPRLRRARTGGQ